MTIPEFMRLQSDRERADYARRLPGFRRRTSWARVQAWLRGEAAHLFAPASPIRPPGGHHE